MRRLRGHVAKARRQRYDPADYPRARRDPKRAEEFGGEYGPYIMSRFTTGADGRCRIYYTMSTWNPYQVMVMRSDLKLETTN